MIYLYPANKMENLLVLLDKIQQISPLAVFSPEIIVVQNPGMQHWLNLSLATQRGISMNIRYVLPAQFLWQLMRSLASDEEVPDQSPYSREVLTWRICALLASDMVCENSDFEQATNYWKQENDPQRAALKRYQLSTQLADLYEQYLIFRPDWIDGWEKQEAIFTQRGLGNADTDTNTEQSAEKNALFEIEHWQGLLWQLLIKEQAYNPVALMAQAIANISAKKAALPQRIVFFGINAMAPMWLTFINALSEHIDIHFFHLNPCYAYWGDIVSEKQAMKAITAWVDGYDDIRSLVGNPLLASFGQQGREFMALLHSYSMVNIDVFEQAGSAQVAIGDLSDNSAQLSVLSHLQNDILSLTDARQSPQILQDDSIIISSCHSALREVQGLHDWLLHQFNDDKELTPKDILVMCPQIESYAPYVNAVFTRGWQDIDDKIPPLPCSIADRSSKDAEPLIAAFIELLNLPDSRFSVSGLIGLLRLPAMQLKFGLSIEDLDKITVWVEQAAIHWGLDQAHKAQILDLEQGNNSFTWQQGLSRLLTGFAYGDSSVIYQQQLLLPTIEGGDGHLLGQLMLIIEQLQHFSRQLSTDRDAYNWQKFLLALLDDLFVVTSDNSFELIFHAIESLVEYCSHAHYEGQIELTVIRDFLGNHFSLPDPGRQFMVGQVTFCSMIPMRSIPFKIIAVLGLNDGEFPRQRQPLGFDLLAMTPAKLGDRSRRGDDRYLFLEAIISARKALYLSYQGRNIKTNAPRQASLVLKELMEYLSLGYGWQLLDENSENIRQLPMQPFSDNNYCGQFPGFDEKWLTLGQKNKEKSAGNTQRLVVDKAVANGDEEKAVLLPSSQLISFFQHPAKQFAHQQLNLHFEQYSIELDDNEPFTADRLQSYLLREQMLSSYLSAYGKENSDFSDEENTAQDNEQDHEQDHEQDNEQAVMDIADVITAARLSGRFPDLPTTAELFENWRDDSEQFSRCIIEQNAASPQLIDCQLTLNLDCGSQITLVAKLPVQQQQLVFYRSSSAKAKDIFTLYLHQLMVQVWQDQNVAAAGTEEDCLLTEVKTTRGFYFDTKSQKVTQYQFSPLTNAKEQLKLLLSTFLTGQQQALLLNGDLAQHYFKASARGKEFTQADFEKYWSDSNAARPPAADPYIDYFWPSCPLFSDYQQSFNAVYQPMYLALEKIKS